MSTPTALNSFSNLEKKIGNFFRGENRDQPVSYVVLTGFYFKGVETFAFF